jgi:hypothetical protein
VEGSRTTGRTRIPAGVPPGRRRLALLVPLLALSGATCVGDLLHPSTPRVAYVFEAPLSDTIVDIGDTTPPLACHLQANGRPLECVLEVSAVSGGQYVSVLGGRLRALGVGTSTVRMRPLSVFLPFDTIVRTATIRSVVPVVRWADGRTADTLAVGAMKLLIPLPMTRAGGIIAGAPLRLVVDSGAAFVHFLPGLSGWMVTDAVGVAVVRAVSDTAATPPRRVVVVTGSSAVTDGLAAPSPPVRR